MHTATLRIIRDEHSALAAMLRSIPLLLTEHRRNGTLPDFATLRAMLFYVDEFPERLHHPKESGLLFPMLRARSPLMRETLDKLDAEHARGERAIRDLQHALLGFEMMGEARRTTFEQAAERYVSMYLTHMEVEERHILPLTCEVFTPEDWAELDEAFLANCDPLTGHPVAQPYTELFSKILRMVPAPIGLGATSPA